MKIPLDSLYGVYHSAWYGVDAVNGILSAPSLTRKTWRESLACLPFASLLFGFSAYLNSEYLSSLKVRSVSVPL